MDWLIVGIVSVLEGAVVVGGLSALGAGLYGIGIPKNSVLDYEAALKSGKFSEGTTEEVTRAKHLLQSQTAATQTDLLSSEPVVSPAPVAA
jgi:hypothetical protein